MSEYKDENIYDKNALTLISLAEEVMLAGSYVELRDCLTVYLKGKLALPAFFFQVVAAQPGLSFFSDGVSSESVSSLQEHCVEESSRLVKISNSGDSYGAFTQDSFTVFPLNSNTGCVGLLGVESPENNSLFSTVLWRHFLVVLAYVISDITIRREEKRELEFLNTYMSVSSLLAQEIGLHDILEATLYCCMENFSAEAASILLLDDEKENFIFYQVAGEAELELNSSKLSVNQGVAGAVLQSGESRMVNNLDDDPNFHRGMDDKTQFKSRNMIAIPLIAGEEQVGVLEIINKLAGQSFLEEEHQSLKILGEEIAFAIRNAKIFEYVITSYCKQRQGLNTCKGCKRPLGTWTPCIKYRENLDG